MVSLRPEPPRPWTVEEFLDWERAQPERYEFVDGVIRMMVGGTLDHNTIAGNVFSALKRHLQGGPCRAFMEGVKVKSGGATMYPDVVVSCQPGPGTDDMVREPELVVEVLSRTTEAFDRGSKWQAYQELPSLRQFVLVSQNEFKVEVFEREAEGWRYRVLRGPEAALNFSRSGGITLRELYENTTLAAPAAHA